MLEWGYSPMIDICKESRWSAALQRMIRYDSDVGWRIRPACELLDEAVLPRPGQQLDPIGLRDYFFPNEHVDKVCEHNRRWAQGLEEEPRFLFTYINLPTGCNLSCAGCFQSQDKHPVPARRIKNSLIWNRLDEILGTLKHFGGQSVIYAGRGELFTDPDAFEYIERIRAAGLNMVIFTNGTFLMDIDMARQLADLDVSVILSFRDTTAIGHDRTTGRHSFEQALCALDNFLQLGLAEKNRLAAELPVTTENSSRAADMLVFCRQMNIFPLIEMYIVTALSRRELSLSLTFDECDKFFLELARIDRSLGYRSNVCHGQRVVGQPMCLRPHYSFTVDMDGDVIDCPAHKVAFGRLTDNSLSNILLSQRVRDLMGKCVYCPCSVFASAGMPIKTSILTSQFQELVTRAGHLQPLSERTLAAI